MGINITPLHREIKEHVSFRHKKNLTKVPVEKATELKFKPESMLYPLRQINSWGGQQL